MSGFLPQAQQSVQTIEAQCEVNSWCSTSNKNNSSNYVETFIVEPLMVLLCWLSIARSLH